VGIVTNTVKLKRQKSRSMDMRYLWLLDGAIQNYFILSITQDMKILQITLARVTRGPITWQCARFTYNCLLPPES
jgi:hypothetical protein